jgi:soluble P-type ATPase
MLTGDSASAALSVANDTGFFDNKLCERVAILDVNKNHELKWVIMSHKKTKVIQEKDFTLESTKSIITKQQSGRYAIMSTGDGVEVLLSCANGNDFLSTYMLENFDKISVFARTSPKIKQQVLATLKSHCQKKVMMCGDGVNDISAMKTADISAALLSGYGNEVSAVKDVLDDENERRKAKLKMRNIGKLRNSRDFGTETHYRLRMKLEATMKENAEVQPSIGTIFSLIKDEYRRAIELRKGGASAARILQREESLRKAIVSDEKENALFDTNEHEDVESIKPGEASLAAPFTFLRPCVDGTDAIIRSGIAAAAFSLSSHR